MNERLYRRLRTGFLSSTLAAAVAVPALIYPELARMDRLVQEYTAAMERFPERARFLTIHLESPVFGHIRPLTRANDYYLIEKGGAHGGSIGTMNTLAIVWYRHYPVSDTFPYYAKEMSDAEFQAMLSAYDCVLVWGDDRQLDQRLRTAGARVSYKKGRLSLFENPQRQLGLEASELSTAQLTQRIVAVAE